MIGAKHYSNFSSGTKLISVIAGLYAANYVNNPLVKIPYLVSEILSIHKITVKKGFLVARLAPVSVTLR